ncbi:MAG: hypothetical protein NTY06_01550 [Candidatus Gottesmanbacteria bacterium]|nr:hypothetical protein [Candidatus Gottesmanbacteria bacterium]
MGLDKELPTCLNECMNMKSLLQKLGLGAKTERKSPIARERERFEAEVKEQFQKLKDKGLSIPVFTL